LSGIGSGGDVEAVSPRPQAAEQSLLERAPALPRSTLHDLRRPRAARWRRPRVAPTARRFASARGV